MSAAVELVRRALSGRRAWLVGGLLRDRLLERATGDVDVVVDGDPGETARLIAQAARAAGGAACFPLSEEFGAWRVVARDRSWQIDVERLRAPTLEGDLALRDFTVNAVAEAVGGSPPIDPLGGLGDLRERRLRMAGPSAFADDPLRVLRLVRMAVELDLEATPETVRAAREEASRLADVSGERAFVELRRTIAAAGALRGMGLLEEVGALAVVLPELAALRGVEQSRFHHLDVYDHTLEVLARTIELTAGTGDDPLSSHRAELAAALREPLADELTRGQALRWGALLHDAAKPLTRAVRPGDGRVTFLGHDEHGVEVARGLLERLRTSERLRAHVAGLVRHHLRLGFLVHEPQPLDRRTVYQYLRATAPVEVDVTVLSVADRLATRGAGAERAIAAHLQLAQAMLGDALRWRAEGPPQPLLRGDELARELGIEPGPALGRLLEGLAEARYAGEIATREQALAHARLLAQSN
jgi:putative nucleotidyltransferase with HDIG domain